VKRLQRVRIVNIKLGGLKVGRWRNLTDAELRACCPLAGLVTGSDSVNCTQ